MRLVIHIGTEKTGTSSVQVWLNRSAERLRGHGFWYSAVLGRPNNRLLGVFGRDSDKADDGFYANRILTPADHDAFRERLQADLAAEIEQARQAGCHTFIVSNEHCHSRLTSPAMVRRVQDLFGPGFTNTRILCLLRPQMDLCLSFASTAARMGTLVDRAWFDRTMTPASSYYNYDRLVQRWAEVFGADALTVIAFKRNPDAVVCLANELGIELAWCAPLVRSNTALDVRTIAIANALRVGRFNDDKSPNKNRGFYADQLPLRDKLSIDRDFAQALQQRFDQTNAATIARCPSLQPDDLVPRWEAYPDHGNMDLLDCADQIAPQLRYIVERFNAELWLERSRRTLAEAERAQLKGNQARWQRLLAEAQAATQQAAAVPDVAERAEMVIARVNAALEAGMPARRPGAGANGGQAARLRQPQPPDQDG